MKHDHYWNITALFENEYLLGHVWVARDHFKLFLAHFYTVLRDVIAGVGRTVWHNCWNSHQVSIKKCYNGKACSPKEAALYHNHCRTTVQFTNGTLKYIDKCKHKWIIEARWFLFSDIVLSNLMFSYSYRSNNSMDSFVVLKRFRCIEIERCALWWDFKR